MAADSPRSATALPVHIISNAHVFSPASSPTASPSVLLLLNQPLRYDLVAALWAHTSLHVAADGAANRLLQCARDIAAPLLLPHVVIGDCDSLHSATRASLTAAACSIVCMQEQDSTDLQKALCYVWNAHKPPGAQPAARFIDCMTPTPAADLRSSATVTAPVNVVVYGAFGGRLDHEMSALNTLMMAESARLFHSIVMMSDVCVARTLRAKSVNTLQVCAGVEGPNCGILPLYGPSIISTTGLVWDVLEWDTRFGGAVSTSNALKGGDVTITVHSDLPLLWTCDIRAEALVEALTGEAIERREGESGESAET